MYDIWLQEIAEIAAHANKWLTFSEICAWIGFAASMFSLILLIVRWRHERRTTGRSARHDAGNGRGV